METTETKPAVPAAQSTAITANGANGANGTNGTKPEIVFGINFEINGTLVPLTTVIGDPSKNGMEFALPGPVDLGTIADFITWFSDTFKVDLPDGSTFPAPLDGIVGKLSDLDFTVTQFHVKVPPSSDSTGTQYTFALSALWPGAGIDLIPDVLSIQGATFGLSNEEKPADTPDPDAA
jgi:hypothetical protein